MVDFSDDGWGPPSPRKPVMPVLTEAVNVTAQSVASTTMEEPSVTAPVPRQNVFGETILPQADPPKPFQATATGTGKSVFDTMSVSSTGAVHGGDTPRSVPVYQEPIQVVEEPFKSVEVPPKVANEERQSLQFLIPDEIQNLMNPPVNEPRTEMDAFSTTALLGLLQVIEAAGKKATEVLAELRGQSN